jgi:hypothetical protein
MSIALFVLISKLIYFPVGHFFRLLTSVLDSGPNSIYRFVFDFDWRHVTERLLESLWVAKDLWFLPNFETAIVSSYAAIAALIALAWLAKSRRTHVTRDGMLLGAAIVSCYVIAVAPLIFSLGGLISYRTMLAPTAIVMVVVLYLLRELHRVLVPRLQRHATWMKSPDIALLPPVLVAICWATSYSICSVIQVCQNEIAWVASAVREAKAKHADGLVFIDGRATISPEELRVASDAHGHALLPYESGCFSTYCIFAPGIYEAAKVELGLAPEAIQVMIVRDESLRGVPCEAFIRNMQLHAGLLGWSTIYRFAIRLHEFLQEEPKFECREYDTKWLDLEWHADSSILKSSSRIDESIWRIFLPAAK